MRRTRTIFSAGGGEGRGGTGRGDRARSAGEVSVVVGWRALRALDNP